jgi:hypothetical protein
MAHDFAKQHTASNVSRRRGNHKAAATKVSDSRTHWPWFFSGLLSGLFVAFIILFGFYRPGLLQNPGNLSAQDASVEGPIQDQGTDFTFYDRLSAAEVVVDVVAVELEPRVEENPEIFRVQAASFNTRQDAEDLRAEILLLGMQANIYEAEVLGQMRYRVQAGPFTGNRQAEDAIRLLANNNIAGAIKIRVQ